MKLIIAIVACLFSFNCLAADNPPTKVKPVKIIKPCKPGQTADKDKCHEVKKYEPVKKKPVKKIKKKK